ncbi:MAG: hypothetical protein HZA51_16525 [Planctomycetes bacterium]|nr:hypothetical protein [Planctomycetota bacterium]
MNNITLSVDRFTRTLLVTLTLLLAVIAVELWIGQADRNTVSAQIPDTGLQRQNIVEEARRTNQLLEQILTQLRTGTMKVRSESADKPEGKKGKSAP